MIEKEVCMQQRLKIVFHEEFGESLCNAGDMLKLVLFRSGTAAVELNGTQAELAAPGLLFINELDRVRLVEQKRLMATTLAFSPMFINQNLTFDLIRSKAFCSLAEIHDFNKMHAFFHKDESFNGFIPVSSIAFIRALDLFYEAESVLQAEKDEWWSCKTRDQLLRLLTFLDSIYDQRQNHTACSEMDEMIRTVLEYIHANYFKNIAIAELCDLIHLNKTTLSTEFKQRTGMTIIKYLNDWRIKNACKALELTNLPINRISEDCGYHSFQYFVRQFYHAKGVSPQNYRERMVLERKQRFQRGPTGSFFAEYI